MADVELMEGNPQPDSQQESKPCYHSSETTAHVIASASPVKVRGPSAPLKELIGGLHSALDRENSANLSRLLELSHGCHQHCFRVIHCGARLEQCQGCVWNPGVLKTVVQNKTFDPLRLYYHGQKELG